MEKSIYELEIFKEIEKNVVDEIIENCEQRKYNAWEIIVIQNEESNWEWYIIKLWEVSVNIDWEDITKLKSWDIFWEIALLNEEERTATIKALTDTEVIVLSIENILNIINIDSNNINKTIMKRIEENLSR